MEIYNLKCPNCGATLSTDVKNNRAKCEYCGNEFVISDDTGTAAKQPDDKDNIKTTDNNGQSESEHEPLKQVSTAGPEKKKRSRIQDFLIVFCIIATGLALSLMFDKERPQDIVPATDLHRFFMELDPNSTPSQAEALAKKHNLHFFKIEKAVNTADANTLYYKIAKTNETALNKKGEHGETVEIEFDATRNDTLMWAVYSDPEHIVSRAILFRYGTYYSLSTDKSRQKDVTGYYFYNNSLRSNPDSKNTGLPYLKCTDAKEALKKIYTYKK